MQKVKGSTPLYSTIFSLKNRNFAPFCPTLHGKCAFACHIVAYPVFSQTEVSGSRQGPAYRLDQGRVLLLTVMHGAQQRLVCLHLTWTTQQRSANSVFLQFLEIDRILRRLREGSDARIEYRGSKKTGGWFIKS